MVDKERLRRDRDYEMALIAAGIIPHYLPLNERQLNSGATEDLKFKLAEKGVDVKLALDVLDLAHEDRFDIAVIITGDGDLVPLIRKVTSIGKQVLVAHFSIEPWDDTNGMHHRASRCSRALLDAASWSLNFNAIVTDNDWKNEVGGLFFKPK